ncbi:hypothetical protein DFP72DRAFT_1152459 [Ephemerocybe angulata]|uniref:Uncharacterized protein n=1 Tax=Ephemerocybe angulata TaxID=980116 RepID=A0A8H6HG73_9AGAR|nr:hypothetical protein DFP72DRAFT_1152459 [Tulosesus angulatus]
MLEQAKRRIKVKRGWGNKSGSSVLAIPVPATDAIYNDFTSLAARELSYEPSVEARAFDFDALTLEERGLRSGLRKLKQKITGGSSAAAPAELERRELGEELVERGEGKSSTPPRKGGGVSSMYYRSISAADLRRRGELVLRTLRNLSLRRRELEGEIVDRVVFLYSAYVRFRAPSPVSRTLARQAKIVRKMVEGEIKTAQQYGHPMLPRAHPLNTIAHTRHAPSPSFNFKTSTLISASDSRNGFKQETANWTSKAVHKTQPNSTRHRSAFMEEARRHGYIQHRAGRRRYGALAIGHGMSIPSTTEFIGARQCEV